MSTKSQYHKELSRLIWKKYAAWSHNDKKLSGMFNEDIAFWHGLGNQYVKEIEEDMSEIFPYLEDASKKTRKKIFKILVKEYMYSYKIAPIEIGQRNLTDKK